MMEKLYIFNLSIVATSNTYYLLSTMGKPLTLGFLIFKLKLVTDNVREYCKYKMR